MVLPEDSVEETLSSAPETPQNLQSPINRRANKPAGILFCDVRRFVHPCPSPKGRARPSLVPSVAALIRDNQNRLLLQRKAGSEGWSLPAGAIEPGETPEEALCREVLEETGLKVSTSVLVAAFGGRDFRYTYPNGDKVEYTVLVYRCAVQRSPHEPIDLETVELRFFEATNAPPLALPYPRSVLFE